MVNPGLPDLIWAKLEGRLWHATEREALHGIISGDTIKAGIGDRYKTSFTDARGACVYLIFGQRLYSSPAELSN